MEGGHEEWNNPLNGGDFGFKQYSRKKQKETFVSRGLKHKPSTRRLKITLSLSILALLISLITGAAFLYVVLSNEHSGGGLVVYHGNQICVPCQMMKAQEEDPLNEEEYVIKNANEHKQQLCCFNNNTANGLQRILDVMQLKESMGTRKNSLHVYYTEARSRQTRRLSHINDPISKTPQKVAPWETLGNRVHLGEGIKYDKTSGRFTISVPGHYMLYSHMTFQPPRHRLHIHHEQGHNLTFLFQHIVSVHMAPQYEAQMLKDASEVTCPVNDQYAGELYPCHVSSLMGMVSLKEGDSLSVKVAPAEFLLGDLESSYFMVYLVE